MAGTLQVLAEKAALATGTNYQVEYQTLRLYIKSKGEDVIIREIGLIDNAKLARWLLAAGLTMRQQEALAARIKRLQG